MSMATAIYPGPTPASAEREARRRFVVKAVFFIFILSLVEGPLRKWFLPGLATPLTILRDPFVIALYAYCLAHGLMLRRGIAKLWLGFAIITSIVGLAQYAAQGLPAYGWMLGVRTYWLYMPLAFVVAKTFTREDIHRFLRLCLWIAIPYAFLVAAQYNAPPYVFINLGVGADESGAVGVGDGILRPFGLFTYTGPNVQFTAFMIAVFIAFYVGDVQMRRRGLFLVASGAAVGAMSVLTGSRLIYLLAAGIFAITLLGMTTARPSGRTLRRALGIISLPMFAAALLLFAFPDMLDAMIDRFNRAARSEGGIYDRIYYSGFTWLDALFDASVFGYAIGAGAPGVARMLDLPALFLGEADTQRNVRELGVLLGGSFLLLRWGTTAWVLFLAFRLAVHKSIWALPLAGYVTVPLTLGQITHSPINAFLPWLSIGLIIALRNDLYRDKLVRRIPHASN
ncbi:MAG: hypothetical protein RI571_14575 [Roseovarius sp.]|nr:hypothetical protein [Roseovarius sp.]